MSSASKRSSTKAHGVFPTEKTSQNYKLFNYHTGSDGVPSTLSSTLAIETSRKSEPPFTQCLIESDRVVVEDVPRQSTEDIPERHTEASL